MASFESPASSAGSSPSNSHHRRPQTLDDLVTHFVAAKRALNSQTSLWRANEIVTSARELLEENALLFARNSAIKALIYEQEDTLEAIRRGMHVVETDTQADFKRTIHSLDVAFDGLQSTLTVLRQMPIETALQPPGTPQKHLLDFVDTTTVSDMKDTLKGYIDRYNQMLATLVKSNDAFDTALANLHSSIDSLPSTPTASTASPVPDLYYDLEGHAKEAAQAFQMLVSHYDLCVTALRHTEGGSDAATQATGDVPEPSGGGISVPPEPISEEERQEMLSVLSKDALEVEDVVSEIRERASEMGSLLAAMEKHVAHLRNEDAALGKVLCMTTRVATEAKLHVATSRAYQTSWFEDNRPELLNGIDEWENQRDFYERFELAYAELLLEVASRRRRHEKAKRKAEEAQKELDKLHAEDERAREQFTLVQGDFLPQDIWPGLRRPPRRYEVRIAEEEDDEGGTAHSIPQLGRNVVERALARVKRKMHSYPSNVQRSRHSELQPNMADEAKTLPISDPAPDAQPEEASDYEDIFDDASDDDLAPELIAANLSDYTKAYNRQLKLNDPSTPPAEKPKTNSQKPLANTRASLDDQIEALSKHAGKIKLNARMAGVSGGGARDKDKSDRATSEQVLDDRTRMILLWLLNRNIVSEIHGVISTGKEANVYHALQIPEDEDAQPVFRAIKVYKTAILVFKDRERYVTGEFRFRQGYNKHNNRAMVKLWAEKETRNLKRLVAAGIPCPRPLHLRLHVLVMEFLGDRKGRAAPRLKDVVFTGLTSEEEQQKWKELYIQMLAYVRVMYQVCRLVHADLSEYNVLFHEGKCWVIDVSQSVEHEHPASLEFLRKDIKNVNDFFRSRGVEVLRERQVFGLVTKETLGEAEAKAEAVARERGAEGKEEMFRGIEEYVERLFEEREHLTPEEKEREDEDDRVFREQYIPQTLQQVVDVERDVEALGRGEGEGLVYRGLLAESHEQGGEGAEGGEEEESESEGSDGESGDESRFEKGPSRGKKNMDKDAKREHKKAVKEEKREKRKEKMPKHLKKKLVSQGSRKNVAYIIPAHLLCATRELSFHLLARSHSLYKIRDPHVSVVESSSSKSSTKDSSSDSSSAPEYSSTEDSSYSSSSEDSSSNGRKSGILSTIVRNYGADNQPKPANMSIESDVPAPGSVYLIINPSTHGRISLRAGELIIADASTNNDISNHWKVVEEACCLGLRNVVSGGFIGTTEDSLQCQASTMGHAERVEFRHQLEGGYRIVLSSNDRKRFISTISPKGQPGKLLLGTKGTRFSFKKVTGGDNYP
ncbi:RIO1-domain-containing protein [Sporormia fimetaria CBS 119925]|uniref:Serine/threonine-protein kinase RIO1 n=1 Tax=Sporormia fimetaria CBS 119925 TaxID=1340428 RepID=A0A6A6V0U3_9PLEO|nr:RIO1-domain-containing protein [Sporormia fimetaria CBS 119925]